MNRRAFLKAGAVGTALPAVPLPASNLVGEKPAVTEAHGVPEKQGLLPGIPESRDLASHRLVYEYSEIFNPPPAQNEWGFCQSTRSVAGITAILFPPFACCGAPSIPTPGGEISPGNLITCEHSF